MKFELLTKIYGISVKDIWSEPYIAYKLIIAQLQKATHSGVACRSYRARELILAKVL